MRKIWVVRIKLQPPCYELVEEHEVWAESGTEAIARAFAKCRHTADAVDVEWCAKFRDVEWCAKFRDVEWCAKFRDAEVSDESGDEAFIAEIVLEQMLRQGIAAAELYPNTGAERHPVLAGFREAAKRMLGIEEGA